MEQDKTSSAEGGAGDATPRRRARAGTPPSALFVPPAVRTQASADPAEPPAHTEDQPGRATRGPRTPRSPAPTTFAAAATAPGVEPSPPPSGRRGSAAAFVPPQPSPGSTSASPRQAADPAGAATPAKRPAKKATPPARKGTAPAAGAGPAGDPGTGSGTQAKATPAKATPAKAAPAKATRAKAAPAEAGRAKVAPAKAGPAEAVDPGALPPAGQVRPPLGAEASAPRTPRKTVTASGAAPPNEAAATAPGTSRTASASPRTPRKRVVPVNVTASDALPLPDEALARAPGQPSGPEAVTPSGSPSTAERPSDGPGAVARGEAPSAPERPPAEPSEGGPDRSGVAVGRARVAGRAPEVLGQAELWAVIRTRPQFAPVALALLAVARYAEPARSQAEWLTRTYPGVAPERLAGVAVASATRRSRRASVLVITPFGVLSSGAAHLAARARLVVEVAAIFGYNPADPARAAEILSVLRAYPDTGSAAAAVNAVLRGEPPAEQSTAAGAGRPGGTFALVELGTATGARLARKVAARYIPGSVLVAEALGGPAATVDAGHRAIRLYRAR